MTQKVSIPFPWVAFSIPWVAFSFPWVAHSAPWVAFSIPWVAFSIPWVTHSFWVSGACSAHTRTDAHQPHQSDECCKKRYYSRAYAYILLIVLFNPHFPHFPHLKVWVWEVWEVWEVWVLFFFPYYYAPARKGWCNTEVRRLRHSTTAIGCTTRFKITIFIWFLYVITTTLTLVSLVI